MLHYLDWCLSNKPPLDEDVNNVGKSYLSNNELLFQLPLTVSSVLERGWTGRKALVGRDPCCPVYPWITRHVLCLPEGSSYMFVQHDTKTHDAFLPLLCSELQGFRKTNRPLKILGARDAGQGFSCTPSSVRVGHWGKRKWAALVVWGLPAWYYKELLSCQPPHSVAQSHWRQ